MYIMSNPEFCYETCTNFLRDVYDKYPEHLHPKIVEFVKKELPYKLDGCISRIERIKDLEAGADAFINEFLINSERKFMYIGKSDIFIEYDGKQFKLVNESEILHEILTGLTEEKSLHDWKHKIKNMIVKKIKDTNMFHTIPESYTIQQVLSHMTPLLFKTKEEAKYFLSVIGDNIQKSLRVKFIYWISNLKTLLQLYLTTYLVTLKINIILIQHLNMHGTIIPIVIVGSYPLIPRFQIKIVGIPL